LYGKSIWTTYSPSRPVAFKKEGNYVLDEALTANPYPTWQKLEELVDKGKIRNIGISK
jgi:diketogulonate reductase-like aldo/keto reductase